VKWVIIFIGLVLLFALFEYKQHEVTVQVKSNTTPFEKVKKVPPNYGSGSESIVKPDQVNWFQFSNEKICNELYFNKIHESDSSEKVTYANTAFLTDWVSQFTQSDSTSNQGTFYIKQRLGYNSDRFWDSIDSELILVNESNK